MPLTHKFPPSFTQKYPNCIPSLTKAFQRSVIILFHFFIAEGGGQLEIKIETYPIIWWSHDEGTSIQPCQYNPIHRRSHEKFNPLLLQNNPGETTREFSEESLPLTLLLNKLCTLAPQKIGETRHEHYRSNFALQVKLWLPLTAVSSIKLADLHRKKGKNDEIRRKLASTLKKCVDHSGSLTNLAVGTIIKCMQNIHGQSKV